MSWEECSDLQKLPKQTVSTAEIFFSFFLLNHIRYGIEICCSSESTSSYQQLPCRWAVPS